MRDIVLDNDERLSMNSLLDITESLEPTSYFSETETEALTETCVSLIEDHLRENPLQMSNPEFLEQLETDVLNMLFVSVSTVCPFVVEDELIKIYQTSLTIVFTTFVPRRSYKRTFIRHNIQKQNISKKLEDLRSRPQPQQCTDEWYLFRWNLLSASSAWKAFGTEASVNSLIVEKCKPIDVNKYKSVNTESTLHHGKKYEPVSILYYEYYYGAKVEEFGCIKHAQYGDFLGASPDGIVVNEDNDRYGRMLEIKNVVSRKITGIPKEMYWIQMQLQMEVCNLNECDFLETSISEYDTIEEFNNDGDFKKSASGKYKGIIIHFLVDGQPYYEYAPFQCSEEEFHVWQEDIMQQHLNHTWIRNIYYRIDHISCVLVLRNKLWAQRAIEVLRDVWQKILYDRENGYEHRLPNKCEKRNREQIAVVKLDSIEDKPSENKTDVKTGGCLIDLSQFGFAPNKDGAEHEQHTVNNSNNTSLDTSLDTTSVTETYSCDTKSVTMETNTINTHNTYHNKKQAKRTNNKNEFVLTIDTDGL